MSKLPDTRQRILDAARQLVLERGFAATSVDAVLSSAGASKGAFFHHFPSKSALGRTLVERYAAEDAEFLDHFLGEAEAGTEDPAEQLVAMLRAIEEASESALAVQPNCLFVSFIYESELHGADTEEIVERSIRYWRGRILAKLHAAADRRPNTPPVDLPSLADQFFTVFEGAFLLARATNDRSAMRRQLAHLRHYLELLFGLKVDVN